MVIIVGTLDFSPLFCSFALSKCYLLLKHYLLLVCYDYVWNPNPNIRHLGETHLIEFIFCQPI